MRAAAAVALVSFVFPTAARLAIGDRQRSLSEVALEVPQTVAIDLLAILALAYFVPLDVSVLISRMGWLLGFAAYATIRRRRGSDLGWPRCLSVRVTTAGLGAALVAWATGQVFFPNHLLWDRPWHTPLVTSLAGQSVPFRSVFDPIHPLRYHVGGDVAAAVFRASSLDVLSSNAALTMAHDVQLGLAAFGVCLLLAAFGARPWAWLFLGPLAFVLQGPLPWRAPGVGQPLEGYAYHVFFTVAYRPHVSLAALMMVGFVGALALRARSLEGRQVSGFLLTLFATAAVLAISDEASLALLGASAGVLWLFVPAMFGASRSRGFLTLMLLAIVAAGAHLAFSPSLGGGGPIRKIEWAPAAAPAFLGAALPLATEEGRRVFALDVLPIVSPWLGLVIYGSIRRDKSATTLAIFMTALGACCIVLATKVSFNGVRDELQRFFVAPLLVACLYGLLFLSKLPRGSMAQVLMLLGVAIPPAYTVLWLTHVAPTVVAGQVEGPANDWAKEPTFDVDCRRVAGARIGQRPAPTYVDVGLASLYASCRPIFGFGSEQWGMPMLISVNSRDQFKGLQKSVIHPGDALDFVCARTPPAPDASAKATGDPVCSVVVDAFRSTCHDEGERFVRCRLSSEQQSAVAVRM